MSGTFLELCLQKHKELLAYYARELCLERNRVLPCSEEEARKRFVQNMRKMMEAKDLTFSEFACIAECSASYLWEITAGITKIYLETAKKIAEALGTDVGGVIFFDEQNEDQKGD